jgi:hypothetical protein
MPRPPWIHRRRQGLSRRRLYPAMAILRDAAVAPVWFLHAPCDLSWLTVDSLLATKVQKAQGVSQHHFCLDLTACHRGRMTYRFHRHMSSSEPPATTGTIGPGLRSRRLLPVDPRVRNSLRDVAVRHARRGVRVFLFGSVARTWPCAPLGADFDLGYEIDRSRGDENALRRDLERDMASLQSIRPVDLVDFSLATAAFRAEAGKHIVELAHEPPATAAD